MIQKGNWDKAVKLSSIGTGKVNVTNTGLQQLQEDGNIMRKKIVIVEVIGYTIGDIASRCTPTFYTCQLFQSHIHCMRFLSSDYLHFRTYYDDLQILLKMFWRFPNNFQMLAKISEHPEHDSVPSHKMPLDTVWMIQTWEVTIYRTIEKLKIELNLSIVWYRNQ